MKQLFLLGVAVVLSAVLFAGGIVKSGTVSADPFNDKIQNIVTFSTTAAGSTPDQTVTVNIDCPGGPGAACPVSSLTPFFDIAVTSYSANILSCTTGSPAPCSGSAVPIDAIVGSTNFKLNTSIVAADLPNNVNATTGVPQSCGDPGTTPLASVFQILNGAKSPGDLVSGKDGPDADTLPDTQADVRGLTPASPANGAPDGADALPDYINLVLGSATALLVGRGYGIAVIVPGAAQTDVNFLTLNLTAFGAGYAAITTLGDVRPATIADANASQATQTCPPFTSTVNTSGQYSDNPNTGVNEGTGAVRAITGTTGDPIHYAIDLSGLEDVDGDGVPQTVDRCNNPEVGLFPASALTSASGTTDTDGDGMGDSCDPDPATRDNCPGTAFPSKSAACNTAGPNPVTYPTKASGCTENVQTQVVTCTTPWNPDQDIDGDNIANWFDNCPTTYNPQQIDNNSDGVGDTCQTLTPTAAGPRPLRPSHDHDDFCDNPTSVGGTTTPSTTCFALTAHGPGVSSGIPTSGVALDSNDDGFPDSLAVPGLTLTDKNSDSDWDGCTDYAETSGALAGGACAGDPRVSNSAGGACIVSLPVSPGIPASSCVDGNKDRNGGGVVDWKDDVNGSPQVGDSNPNGGSADSDGDGCTNRRENLASAPVANGGGRDAESKWDFFDVDTNNAGTLGRNKVISIADTIAILAYVGTNSANPLTPNANGKTYAGDDNLDGIPNSETFDRSPGASNGTITLTAGPNGAVSIADAISNLNQIGGNCSSP